MNQRRRKHRFEYDHEADRLVAEIIKAHDLPTFIAELVLYCDDAEELAVAKTDWAMQNNYSNTANGLSCFAGDRNKEVRQKVNHLLDQDTDLYSALRALENYAVKRRNHALALAANDLGVGWDDDE